MNQTLTGIIKKTPLYCPLRNWLNRRRLRAWEDKGHLVPPPHIIKQMVLLRYAKKYNLRVLVETGTSNGDMVEAMKNSFDRVYSIEFSQDLFMKAKKYFSSDTHIKLIQGDSGIEIRSVMKSISEPTLFWLDAHDSRSTPIYEELNHILRSDNLRHVIVIDDARLFRSIPTYPSPDELRKYIHSRNPNLEISIENDSMRITPV